jgi:hypothetical protein
VTERKRRRIDQVRDPAFLADLESIDTDELRRRRRMCGDLDTELSFYRRLLHGRMDLLAFERRRRSGEDERSLLEALPDILAGQAPPPPSMFTGRNIPIDVPEIPVQGRREIDRVLADDFLARLPDLADGDIASAQAALTEIEAEISEQRRAVFEAHDRVQQELTRRYRDGLADADDLLGSD